jgi:hypothetical protein
MQENTDSQDFISFSFAVFISFNAGYYMQHDLLTAIIIHCSWYMHFDLSIPVTKIKMICK